MGAFASRFFRFTRSTCTPITTIIATSLLLTFIFILYQPSYGPGRTQRLGWQSWDLVSKTGVGSSDAPGGSVNSGGSENQDGSPEGVEWWDVVQTTNKVDPSSLPLDIWAPLLPHDTGLTEIAIERCIIPPAFAETCWPATTAADDAMKGSWVRVERNLNAESGIWYLNLYYRRTRRLDVPLITNIILLPEGEEPTTDPSTWTKVARSVHDGVPRARNLYLWYQLGTAQHEMTQADKQELITELDVLYGEDRPWYGFERLSTPTTQGQEGRIDSTWITFRRGVQPPPKAPTLHFSHNGTFKILQVADLHYSISLRNCRDTALSPCTHADNLTNTLLGRVLDLEKPDMVVFTGDQLDGQQRTWDARSVLAKFSAAVADRGIPWAAVFGNHDSEDGVSREEQIRLMQGLPYSMVEAGPRDIHGVGNYVLKVRSADPSKTHLLTLYFLDSGDYAGGWLDWFGFFHFSSEYDWIHQDQIDWFLQESSEIDAIERPFTPDGAKDLGHIWNSRSPSPDQLPGGGSKRLAKPNALMFFHIPLQESYSKYAPTDLDPDTRVPLSFGDQREGEGSAKKNDGFFEKGLLRATESPHKGDTKGGRRTEVKVVSNGHCHVTENCRRVKGVWLCFGGGGSYAGYGKVGVDRRFRIYDISEYGETIRTWKRTEHDEIVDEMVLVGEGAYAPYEGP